MVSGAHLPGTRVLAVTLGVHRKTVIAAYDELMAQGWIETQTTKGTFVSRKLPEVKVDKLNHTGIQITNKPLEKAGFAFKKNQLLDVPALRGTHGLAFNDGFPDVRLAPWDEISRAYRSVVKQGYRKDLLFYSDISGEYSLRAALTDYLRESRGLRIGIENVLITRGSTMAIYLAAQSIVQSGDVVLVGDLSYGSGNLIFQNAGATLVKVPVDEQGIDVDAMARICEKTSVRLVYVTPHHHYPTTVTMPAERRLRLLQLAEKYHFCVLEDDYDYDFHYDCNPIMPLAGADTGGHVIYVGSLCKVLTPALRVGYAVAPTEVIAGMSQLRRLIDRQGDNLLEAALAMLFRDGAMMRHLKKAQKNYHHRRDVFCELMSSELGTFFEFTKPTGGMAVWARLDPAISLPDLSKKTSQKGLLIPDGISYGKHLNATRLGFASVNESEIERGIQILRGCLG